MTTHWALNFCNTYTIFVNVQAGLARELAFADLKSGKLLTMFVTYEMQVWMGDAILVWRLWLVTGKNYKIAAAPAVTCVGLLVCSCNFLKACSVVNLFDPATLVPVRNWSIAAFSVTLVENVFCASVIFWQMYKTQHDVRYTSQSNLTAIMRIFVECATPWIVVMFITFMAFVANDNVYYIFYYMANPILGIFFCLLTVRLNLRTRKPTHTNNSSTGGTSGVSGGSRTMTGSRKVAFDPTVEDSFEQNHDPELAKIHLSPLRHGDKPWNQESSGEV